MSATMLETLVEQVATLTRERDEARADAARKGGLIAEARNRYAFDHDLDGCSCGLCPFCVLTRDADTASDSWLAEVRATARDEALEEVLTLPFLAAFPHSNDADTVRALKRGGK